MIERFFPNILLTMSAAAYTAYLICIRTNKAKRELTMSKFKPGSPAFNMYSKLLSPYGLLISAIITLLFFLSLVISALTNETHNPVAMLLFFMGVFGPILFWTSGRYRKD